jgi:hypothetical protein
VGDVGFGLDEKCGKFADVELLHLVNNSINMKRSAYVGRHPSFQLTNREMGVHCASWFLDSKFKNGQNTRKQYKKLKRQHMAHY